MAPYLPSKILHNLCFSFLLGISAVSRKTENNGYAKFCGANKVQSGKCGSAPVIFFFFISVTSVILISPCHPGHLIYTCQLGVRIHESGIWENCVCYFWFWKFKQDDFAWYFISRSSLCLKSENLWEYLQGIYIGSMGGTLKWFVFLVIMPLPLSLLCPYYFSRKTSLDRKANEKLLHYIWSCESPGWDTQRGFILGDPVPRSSR